MLPQLVELHMTIEHHYRWRCRNAWGKSFTTSFHCTEAQIRREHPEAEAVPGSLIVRTISPHVPPSLTPGPAPAVHDNPVIDRMRAEQRQAWARSPRNPKAEEIAMQADREPPPGSSDHAAWLIRQEARAWRKTDALMARAREGERKPGESEDRPG